MAKVTLTLEDTTDGVSVAVDLAQAPTGIFGSGNTRAVQLSRSMCDLARLDARLNETPACYRQPSTDTFH